MYTCTLMQYTYICGWDRPKKIEENSTFDLPLTCMYM